MSVYEKVRAYLDDNGLKQVAVAQKAGISKVTFNAIMNGKRTLYADDLRAMAYSMLSSGIVWDRVSAHIDKATKQLTPIDEVFFQYDLEQLLQCDPERLTEEIKKPHCASQYTRKQTEALIHTNIPKLVQLKKRYGSVDAFYQKYINEDWTDTTIPLLEGTEGGCHSVLQSEK